MLIDMSGIDLNVSKCFLISMQHKNKMVFHWARQHRNQKVSTQPLQCSLPIRAKQILQSIAHREGSERKCWKLGQLHPATLPGLPTHLWFWLPGKGGVNASPGQWYFWMNKSRVQIIEQPTPKISQPAGRPVITWPQPRKLTGAAHLCEFCVIGSWCEFVRQCFNWFARFRFRHWCLRRLRCPR